MHVPISLQSVGHYFGEVFCWDFLMDFKSIFAYFLNLCFILLRSVLDIKTVISAHFLLEVIFFSSCTPAFLFSFPSAQTPSLHSGVECAFCIQQAPSMFALLCTSKCRNSDCFCDYVKTTSKQLGQEQAPVNLAGDCKINLDMCVLQKLRCSF